MITFNQVKEEDLSVLANLYGITNLNINEENWTYSTALSYINYFYQHQSDLFICAYDDKIPIGGIMSDRSGEYVNKIFTSLKRKVKREGAALEDPFMTLSFLSLIVIPEIKIGERGLFDFKSFSFIENC